MSLHDRAPVLDEGGEQLEGEVANMKARVRQQLEEGKGGLGVGKKVIGVLESEFSSPALGSALVHGWTHGVVVIAVVVVVGDAKAVEGLEDGFSDVQVDLCVVLEHVDEAWEGSVPDVGLAVAYEALEGEDCGATVGEEGGGGQAVGELGDGVDGRLRCPGWTAQGDVRLREKVHPTRWFECRVESKPARESRAPCEQAKVYDFGIDPDDELAVSAARPGRSDMQSSVQVPAAVSAASPPDATLCSRQTSSPPQAQRRRRLKTRLEADQHPRPSPSPPPPPSPLSLGDRPFPVCLAVLAVRLSLADVLVSSPVFGALS